jgi:uncharacterized protein YecE (DUF72 family)
MATRFHIAAKDLRGPIAAYAKRFDLLEVRVVPVEDEDDEPRTKRHGHAKPTPKGAKPAAAKPPPSSKAEPTPTLATLKRWRKQVPPHFDFSVVAGPRLALLRPGPELERDLAVATLGVGALQARCLILRTPPEVTPSALWRERLAKVAERFPRDATHLVWEPTGLWETGDAAVVAKKLGLVLSVDASRDPVPIGNVAYVRLKALGETRSFSESTLDRVVRNIGPRKDVFVVLETDTALVECKRLRRLAQRSRSSKEGGMSRLVRPRGGIVVRDDEQE